MERQLIDFQQKVTHYQEIVTSYEERLSQLQEENQRLRENLEAMSQQPQVTPISELPTVENTSDNRVDKLEAQTARLEQMMQQMMEMISGATNAPRTEDKVVSVPVPQEKTEPARRPIELRQNINWESIPNDQLRNMKVAGAVEEKIYRAFHAIANYNDNAPSNDSRWYIGTTTLSEVSGCNRQAIGNWVKTHQTTVDDHNNKYGLGQYHNKRHKGVKITDLIKLWE
jgi:hypothetical protein